MVRVLKVLLAVDCALILVVGGVWWWTQRDDARASVGNGGLRGSVAPRGQDVPNLAAVDLTPPFPERADTDGDVLLLVATCLDCRSGDILGGGLARLLQRDLPEDADVRVLGWGGNADAWRRKWRLPETLDVHVARTDAARLDVRKLLGVGSIGLPEDEQSGMSFLYDESGRWRTSYSVQQLVPEDVEHDLDALS